MLVNPIPEKVVNYNIYDGVDKLIGVSGEVKLPSMEAMTQTISGAGIAGEYESPTPGHFGSMEAEIPFRILYDQAFNLMRPSGTTVVLRASQQHNDIAGSEISYRPLKITMKVLPKSIDLGKIAVGASSESSNKLEVIYIKVEENGNVLLEYDKINFIFVVNGEDILAQIRSQI